MPEHVVKKHPTVTRHGGLEDLEFSHVRGQMRWSSKLGIQGKTGY